MVKPPLKQKNEETTKTVVGADEFCSTCMEWREYDEEGRCKVCGKLIKKTTRQNKANYDDYGIDGVSDANDTYEDTV